MTTDDTKQHWDREQWAKDDEEPRADKDADQGPVWNRHEMEFDDQGKDDSRQPRPSEEAPDDAGPLSGRGKPSGEQHWERTDR